MNLLSPLPGLVLGGALTQDLRPGLSAVAPTGAIPTRGYSYRGHAIVGHRERMGHRRATSTIRATTGKAMGSFYLE